MKRTEFNIFWEKVKKEKAVNNYPTIHCMVGEDRFTFIAKTKERNEYYTFMKYNDILQFANDNDMDPMEAMDMFYINYCSNTMPILEPEEEEIENIISEEEEEEDITKLQSENQDNLDLSSSTNSLNSHLCIKNIIDPGMDIIEEADGYSDFLYKFFNNIEKKVLSSLDKLDMEKSYMSKTFGEFLRNLFNIVNTRGFVKTVRKYIKEDLIKGLESAENELSVDIGFTEGLKTKLNQLSSQQIDGYTINGKKWFGIKGVTKEVQADIIQIVQNGIKNKSSITDIRKEIKNKFDNFSDWRSEMIARTETNRILNEGKVAGYKESGLEGYKVWSTAIDDRTSPICKRLNGQRVGVDDEFVDPETRKRYSTPPAHPNCRSTVFFKVN